MSRVLPIFLLLLPALAFSQLRPLPFHSAFEAACFSEISTNPSCTEAKIALFFALDETMTVDHFEGFKSQLHQFDQKAKLNKSPKRIFRRIQKEFLDDFEQTSRLADLFDQGKFNCVSGSALMAYYLEKNGFKYDVEELPHHVFLTATDGQHNFIMETTDKFGILRDTEENRLVYHKDTIDNSLIFEQIGFHDNSEERSLVVKGSIDLQQLAGLAYYNEAINHMNTATFETALDLLQKAYFLYPSIRIEKALRYSILKVLNSDKLSREQKKEYYLLMVYYDNQLSAKDRH